MINQAVILAGGKGERLRPLTNHIPKPMALIYGTPFMDYLIQSIVDIGIRKILILVGYKSEVITNYYKNIKDLKIEFSFGTENDRTGKRILNAYEKLDDHFLLLYGDNYWSIDLENIISLYRKLNVSMLTTVFSNKKGTGEYGFENNIVIDRNNYVKEYDKERNNDQANGVDIGYFVVAKNSLDPFVKENISFEMDILPPLIANNQLGAYLTDNQYYYITNIDSLKNFESIVKKNNFAPLSKRYFGG